MNASEYFPPVGTNPLGGRLVRLESVGSTNDYAWQLALDGAEHGLVVVADRQTGGRGRRGRSWLSPPGTNLAFSMLLRPTSLAPDAVPPLSLVAAAALLSCLREDVPDLSIKWPNDLYCGDRKLAGILAEMRLKGRETEFVVVGIGLNVNSGADDWPPELAATAVSMFQAAGRKFDLDEILQRFLSSFNDGYHDYCRQGLRGSVRRVLTEASYLAGRRVSVVVNGRSIGGTAGDIDEQGRLLVYDDHGVCWPVAAGEATVANMEAF